MKRTVTLLLAFLMMVSIFSGCGKNIAEVTTVITGTSAVSTAVSTGPETSAPAEPDQTAKPATTAAATEKPVITTEKQNTSAAATVKQTQPSTKSATTKATTEKPVQTTKKPVTTAPTTAKPVPTTAKPGIQKNGNYTSKADVSLYIHTYKTLPKNFITKDEARALGWPGGSLEPYAPGKCIGGDYFGNYEGLLPKANGREYTECDIDTMGAQSRGAKRIVFSDDGLIYYTSDHYETFTKLYGG